MIKIVKGDLLEAKENLICHQVNAMGAMNSGVAKQIRQKFPEVFNDYIKLVSHYRGNGYNRSDLLGKSQTVKVGRKQWVVNIFGQERYGYDKAQYTDIEALYKAFKTIRFKAEKLGLSVAMPYMIGCYRGGADWKEVEGLLLTAFDGYEVTLYKL